MHGAPTKIPENDWKIIQKSAANHRRYWFITQCLAKTCGKISMNVFFLIGYIIRIQNLRLECRSWAPNSKLSWGAVFQTTEVGFAFSALAVSGSACQMWTSEKLSKLNGPEERIATNGIRPSISGRELLGRNDTECARVYRNGFDKVRKKTPTNSSRTGKTDQYEPCQ